MTDDEEPSDVVPWLEEILDTPDLSGWNATMLVDPAGWEVWGPCPKCKHQVSRTWLLDVLRGGPQPPPSEEPGAAEIPVRCRCGHQHADGKVGCGRSWVVEVEP